MSTDARSRYYSVLRVPFGSCVCKKKSNAVFFLQLGHSIVQKPGYCKEQFMKRYKSTNGVKLFEGINGM